jgi:hypothetical protein
MRRTVRPRERGYVFVEYLVVLLFVGLVFASAFVVILPRCYEAYEASRAVLLAIDP